MNAHDPVLTGTKSGNPGNFAARHFRAASRRSEVAPFIVMDVLSAARNLEAAGASITHMEIGEPGSPAPAAAIAAAQAALARGRIPYTEALGLASLRERIARSYRENHAISVAPERIAVTTGSSGGFVLAFLALFDAGARIAIPSPGYPAYRNILKSLGLVPVEIETGPRDRWALTAAAVEAAHSEQPLAGVLVMSPANPTGVITPASALKDMAEACARLGIWLVSDEIYHGLTYEQRAETALRFDPDAVVINSFSKYFCMTGWRVGWMVVPDRLIRTIERLQQNLTISVPYISQVAAEAAFDGIAEMEGVRAGYARNRARLMQELPRLGLGSFLPIDGAFYAYVDIGHLSNDSTEFCRRMLHEANVAATPGVDFDAARGSRFMRLCFAGTEADVEETLRKLKQWLRV